MKSKNYSPFRTLKTGMLIAAVILAIAFVYTTVGLTIIHKMNGVPFSFENNGTDLTFQSSDRSWAGEEDLLRGKDFRSVVASFELYKILCNKPDVTLIRTKDKKRPWNEAWWFDNYSSPKWKVPYSQPSTFALANNSNCLSIKPSDKDIALAQERADQYITRLKQSREDK